MARYLLVPGDPVRIHKRVASWDQARDIAFHREFRSVTGTYKETVLSAISSGIESSCMAIVAHEAVALGVETFIRVGSTGAIGQGIKWGDLVITSAAVRMDGASQSYVSPEYPAHTSYEVVLALVEAAESLDVRYRVGITATTADFYAGQQRPSSHRSLPSWASSLITDLQQAKVLNVEMECWQPFLPLVRSLTRAGAVCAVYADQVTNVFDPEAGEADCIRVANEAIAILRNWDNRKKTKGKKHFFPSLLK